MTNHDLSIIANISGGHSLSIFRTPIERVIPQHNCRGFFFIHQGSANVGILPVSEMIGVLNGIIDWWVNLHWQPYPHWKILREIGVVPNTLTENITCTECPLELNDIGVADDHNNLIISEFLGHDKIYSTSNGSWCMGIKGEMSGTVCLTFTWYMYIYELFIAFVCFVVCSLL